MKKTILFLAVALLTIAACNKNTPTGGNPEQQVPTLTITSDTLYNIGAEGGEFEITYIIENPTEDGIIETSVNQNWISIPNTGENGLISFSVAENSSTESRTAVITVTYLELSQSIQVTQEGTAANGNEYDVDSLFVQIPVIWQFIEQHRDIPAAAVFIDLSVSAAEVG